MYSVHHVKLAFFTVFVLTLQTGFVARWWFWFSANESSIEHFAQPWFILCVKKHCCQQSAILQSMIRLKMRKCAVPPDHLHSEISSHALATFQNIGKARKQGEAIW